MPDRPRFKYCFRVEAAPPDCLFLLSEHHTFLLSGSLYQKVASLIDGRRSAQDIARELQNQVSLPEIFFILMSMERKGYLVEATEGENASEAGFWENWDVDASQARDRLAAARAGLHALGSSEALAAGRDRLASALQEINVSVCGNGDNGKSANDADIDIVLVEDYLDPELERYNQYALEHQRPWILAKPVGTVLWLGPLFQPGETGCWQCLANRLEGNRPVDSFVRMKNDLSAPITVPPTALASTLQIAAGMLATAVAQWLAGDPQHPLRGVLSTLDARSLQTERHVLSRRPQCPACGTLDRNPNREPQPIVLQSALKRFTSDGGHRTTTPEETLAKHAALIDPILGVVRDLKRGQLDNDLLHVYVVPHSFPLPKDAHPSELRGNLAGRSGGKGKTDVQARVSGFCEAVERYSAGFQGDEIRHTAALKDLGDRAIHPNDCMLFSEAQYRDRHVWNAECDDLKQRVPEPFDPERAIEWVPVWSVNAETWKYLPAAYCYYGYPRERDTSSFCDSNGCATGNTLEEAILQGFMELVERDCIAMWWYNNIPRPQVDLESFEEPFFLELRDAHTSLNRTLWVLDFTNDLGIPVFSAFSRLTGSKDHQLVCGFGAHFDAKIALMRALTELSQLMPSFSTDLGSDNPYSEILLRMVPDWWREQELEGCPFLLPDPQLAAIRADAFTTVQNKDLRDDVLACAAIARQIGSELLVLDQTRPDVGLRVAKVFVPGLRHFWKRLAPGRLYEVPVKMGWLDRPRLEEEINPYPFFF